MKNLLNKKNACWLVLIAGSYGLISLLISVGVINNVYLTVLMTIGINIILAISLNLIIGVTGQFSLGHAGFMIIGAYCAGVAVKQFSASLGGILLGMLIGIVISGAVALIVAIPTLRLRGDYLAIATLGFGEIIRIIILNMKITNGAAGLILPKLIDWQVIFAAVVICTIIILNFCRSAQGRACISVREDEIAAEAMGINTTKYKIMAFVLGAMIASVAGALYAGAFYVIKPEMFTFNKSIDILVLVVFGGMGSFTGSFIAAGVIGVLNTVLQQFSDIRMILYGLMLVGIMIFRPSGLLGTKEFTFSNLFERFGKRKEARG
ncbi:branched-chain amino acid ABC transporter permease [Holdemania filiformis]|uniref:Branched-chain amino acid ABC transporter, permease protein n=1 Tax=Holdemania filiformis DSM 12042 TaxID=545696 RepID=B9Y8T1_9FIRM|nr:branched-chain amino acid ABC transporter permease [Holdemania filiformis]EEF67600.1 branched-chain amino acid ABC transporter, permease protein [Holdemania filiformis DSM 12042]